MRTTRGGALVAALWLLASGCAGVAPDGRLLALPGAARPEMLRGTERPLGDKARIFERMLERFIAPEGVLTYIQPVGARTHVYRNLADEAIWTGTLLGAEAMRYAATGEPAARQRALRLLEGLYLLSRVGGERGVYARSVWPAAQPGIPPHRRTHAGAGPFAAYRYRGDVSKDQIAGIVFGLAFAATVFGDQPRARALITAQSTALADHLLAHGMRIVERGRPTTHGDLMGFIHGAPIGVNALIALAAIRLALESTGAENYRLAYRRLVEAGYARTARWSKLQIFWRTNHNNDNMQMLASAALLALTERGADRSVAALDREVRDEVRRGLARTWRYVCHEGNAWFTYVTLHALGDDRVGRLAAEQALERFGLDRQRRRIDLRHDPRLRPEPRAPIPNRQHRVRLLRALPVSYRAVTAFVWRSCPYALLQAPRDQQRLYAPVDYLLAYWAGRYWGWLADEPDSAR
ncbi:MAG: hypothetical protein D6776_03515 [Planctomycetota bacterium]|nr:MAG: hypothetical protein D6776_03515 [Planctomycetota bacterium]